MVKSLKKRLSKNDQSKLSKLESSFKRGESSIEEILAILDRYYVYTEESLKNKTETSINPAVNHEISEDILNNYDITSRVDTLKDIPVIVAQGSDDILTPHLIKKNLLDYIPHAKLIEKEKCGHWTVVEKPDEINKIAYDFFDVAY